MKVYLISLATGALVGCIYALLQVRSPAPPAIALVGLFGMLVGEQAVPLAKRLLSDEPLTVSWLRAECVTRISGVQAPSTDAGAGLPSAPSSMQAPAQPPEGPAQRDSAA